MLPAFDERLLAQRLQPLPWFLSLAFGVACAGRLLSNYRKFSAESGWGDIAPLERALGVLGTAAVNQMLPTESEWRNLAAQCEAQAPDSEEFTSLFTSSAQDAVFSVCSLIDYSSERKLEHVVLAARYPTDSVDLYVQEEAQMAAQDPALEDKILAHDLMQKELSRQERDLAVLEAEGAEGVQEECCRE
jgi:uncharacterized protein